MGSCRGGGSGGDVFARGVRARPNLLSVIGFFLVLCGRGGGKGRDGQVLG